MSVNYEHNMTFHYYYYYYYYLYVSCLRACVRAFVCGLLFSLVSELFLQMKSTLTFFCESCSRLYYLSLFDLMIIFLFFHRNAVAVVAIVSAGKYQTKLAFYVYVNMGANILLSTADAKE